MRWTERRPAMADRELTHIDAAGRAHMVDVGKKASTRRTAEAIGVVEMEPATLETILGGGGRKGDVLGVARLAGIMAAKQTGSLIPLCHPVALDHVGIEFLPREDEGHTRLWIKATAHCNGRTGVEMEAMTAVSVAGLTVYDMCKAIDRGMVVSGVRLLRKTGGKSGTWEAGCTFPPGAWR